MVSVRESINQSYRMSPGKRPDGMLWVSDLGNHPAKAMRRIVEGYREEFDVPTHDKMSAGVALEGDTIQRFVSVNGDSIPQFPLFDNIWSGYADLVHCHGSALPRIIEHKGVSSYVFKMAPEKLVKSTHVCQLWLYGQLYRDTYGVMPLLTLYYRGWGDYCEVDLEETGPGHVRVLGCVNDRPVDFVTPYRPQRLRDEIEACYRAGVVPSSEEVRGDVNGWTYAEDSAERLSLNAAKGSR